MAVNLRLAGGATSKGWLLLQGCIRDVLVYTANIYRVFHAQGSRHLNKTCPCVGEFAVWRVGVGGGRQHTGEETITEDNCRRW